MGQWLKHEKALSSAGLTHALCACYAIGVEMFPSLYVEGFERHVDAEWQLAVTQHVA